VSNSVSASLDALFGQMERFVSTKTVVGEPIYIGGVIILPLVDVTFGVGAGAGEKNNEKEGGSSGGGGLGAKVTPSAVLVVQDGSVQLVNVKNQDSVNKLIDMVPGIMSKLNLDSLFSGKKKPQPVEKAENVVWEAVEEPAPGDTPAE